MPHKAIDTGYRVDTTTHIESYPTWSPGSINVTNGLQLQTMVWRQAPASVSNPIRADGTRPPSPYWAKSLVFINDVASVKTTRASGWCVRHSAPAPRFMAYGNVPVKDMIDAFVHPVGVNVENRAKTKFLNELADMRGKGRFDLGVAAGELRETAHMVTDLANKLVMTPRKIADKIEETPERVISWLKKAERMGVENALRHTGRKDRVKLEFVTDAWLTYQLGLRPLASDIYDATVFLKAAQLEDGSSMGITVKGGASEEYRYDVTLVNEGYNGSPVSLIAEVVQVVKIDYSCVYKVPIRTSLQEQLGIDNPGSLAWELCRYSWLADYALGIGDWIRSMTAANGTRFLEGTMSKKRTARIDRLRSVAPSGTTIEEDPARTRMFLNIELFDREVLLRGVMPAAMPGVKHKLSLDHLANALSVLKNFVR